MIAAAMSFEFGLGHANALRLRTARSETAMNIGEHREDRLPVRTIHYYEEIELVVLPAAQWHAIIAIQTCIN